MTIEEELDQRARRFASGGIIWAVRPSRACLVYDSVESLSMEARDLLRTLLPTSVDDVIALLEKGRARTAELGV
jgi:hypothetical protein